MPKSFNFGRLFFPGDTKPIPDEVRIQPLGNHVGNVMELVNLWHKDGFPFPDSLDRVLEAAKIHDMGKPKNFSIYSETSPEGTFKKYIYSFKGHRYDARSKKDFWAQTLAIGHHDFSIHNIARDTYKLKQKSEYTNLLIQEPLAYARELYILEMCDQIEAELACRVLEKGDKQAESRAFMEFTIAEKDKTTYQIDPWPFQSDEPISITFSYWSVCLQEIDENRLLEKCLERKEGRKEEDLGKCLDSLVKAWWKQQPEPPQKKPNIVVTLQPYVSEDVEQSWTASEFYRRLGGKGFNPNAMQEEVFDAIYDPDNEKHPALLLKAPTGKGKTEAIVFPALASGYRLILPLPARSLLDDQRKRIETYLKTISKIYSKREFSLVVDTGSQMYRYIYKNGEEQPKRTQNPRRHLYKADIILTTLDKFLYRYFAFGDRQKSFIFPLRIHEAVSHQKKTLICFDEAHSYNQIAFTNFQSLVRSLYEAGRSLVLMTATMPPQLEEYFDYLHVIDHTQQVTDIPHRSLTWLSQIASYKEDENGERDFADFQNQVTQVVLQEWQSQKGRRILVVVETVRDAAAIYQQLNDHFGDNADQAGRFLFLYHGRIADQLRPDIYKDIKERDNNQQPYVLVTTSAIEVGCDLNAEVLITQICPPENLIQRAGRCNRRGNVEDAKVIIVGQEIPNFANTLDESVWQHYQDVLSTLNTFDTEQIANCISHNPHIDDYRVVELFSMLHDYVYGADLICKPTHEQGLIPTRSWEPSVELRFMLPNEKYHSISVPISRLADKKGQQYAYTCAWERHYDQEKYAWDKRNLGWGSAYAKKLLVTIQDLSDCIFDANLPTYSYNPEMGFVELPKMFSKWVDGAKVKLKYEKNEGKEKHVAIIHYTNSLDE